MAYAAKASNWERFVNRLYGPIALVDRGSGVLVEYLVNIPLRSVLNRLVDALGPKALAIHNLQLRSEDQTFRTPRFLHFFGNPLSVLIAISPAPREPHLAINALRP